MKSHSPVLLKESIDALKIKNNGIYVDLTLGRAGHSAEILKKLSNGKLFSFDKDIQAIIESEDSLKKINNNFELIHSDFKNFKNELKKHNVNFVDGILIDLGVSSPQLDQAERGFSYSKDAPLDMRMNQEQKISAKTVVNEWSENQLIKIFKEYANISLPNRIVKGIINNRPINTTLELVDVIKNNLPAAIVRKKNPSKTVFQAIRIAVNEELEALKQILEDAPKMLNIGGVLAIITFHSIEDRIVKKIFGNFMQVNNKLPLIIEKKWIAKSIKPSLEEIEKNNRSRSAKLRVLTKIKE